MANIKVLRSGDTTLKAANRNYLFLETIKIATNLWIQNIWAFVSFFKPNKLFIITVKSIIIKKKLTIPYIFYLTLYKDIPIKKKLSN